MNNRRKNGVGHDTPNPLRQFKRTYSSVHRLPFPNSWRIVRCGLAASFEFDAIHEPSSLSNLTSKSRFHNRHDSQTNIDCVPRPLTVFANGRHHGYPVHRVCLLSGCYSALVRTSPGAELHMGSDGLVCLFGRPIQDTSVKEKSIF